MRGTWTTKEQTGTSSAFARVDVTLVPRRDPVIEVAPTAFAWSGYPAPELGNAAVVGASFALCEAGTDHSAVIDEIRYTSVDSTPDIVSVTAALAVWHAMGRPAPAVPWLDQDFRAHFYGPPPVLVSG